jgi:hypothetical protein
MKRIVFALVASLCGANSYAQSCLAGEAFGVQAFTCASCGARVAADGYNQFSFQGEPTVIDINDRSAFRRGDIVVSVSAVPITTQHGADLFTYPPADTKVQVRRSGEMVTLDAKRLRNCVGRRVMDPAAVHTVAPIADSTGRVTGPPLMSVAPTAMYGFALACIPSCSRAKANDGKEYWRYDGYPVIAHVVIDGPADKAGARVGDMVRLVREHSVLDEEGALALQNSGRRDTLTLTLRRDGVERKYTLITRRAVMIDSVRRVKMDSALRERFATPRRDTTRPPH